MFFLILYLHLQGCIWFFIVMQDETWIPPLDYVWVETTFYSEPIFNQYFLSVYHSILMLTGNDIGPRGNLQTMFICATLMGGAIVNANLFGELAVIVTTLNLKSSRFQDKLDVANSAMKNMKLPEKTQSSIVKYLSMQQRYLDLENELAMFFGMISPGLKLEVIKHIFNNVLSKNAIFQGDKNLIKFITDRLDAELYMPETNVIT